jgi:hypothetical protein
MQLETSMTFTDHKEAYISAINGKSVCKRQGNNSHISQLVKSWQTSSSFYGPSSSEVVEWLHNGYRQPGLTLDPPVEPIRKRRRLQFAEEGELQLDLMWSGHDYPFLEWSKRDVLPGMRVDIRFNFVASTRVEIIIAYCRWILRALVALEAAGIDLEVWVTTDSHDMFTGNSRDGLRTFIQVKKEGRQTDLLSWSAILSPGGFRHLCFLNYIMGSDAVGHTATRGLGHGTNMGVPWSVTYDPDDRRLRFGCPFTPSNFPEEDMEIQLRDVMLQARKAA